MLLTRAERAAVQEGRLSVAEAKRRLRARVWTIFAGIALGYGLLWVLTRLVR
jgi:hypothetical protein